MNLAAIEKRVSALSPYVKKISVTMRHGHPFARISPDFEALKKAHIINIESELRWYAVELYNMEAEDAQKIHGYEIDTDALSQTSAEILEEPSDEIYKTLKEYIATLSSKTILPSSHLEFDLELDSLDYVQIFTFIEESFGVTMNEAIFSNMMQMQELYEYVKAHQNRFDPVLVTWEKILDEPIDETLCYSPYMLFFYKTLLLPLFKLYCRLEVSGVENIPKTPCIIAPSHQSMLDGFVLVASLPYGILKKCFFLAYEAVFGRSMLRPMAQHGQNIFIDADHDLKRSMQRTALPLKAGENVVIFPEGARTRDRKLLEFRPFFAILAKEYRVPVIPVMIDGSFEALRAGMLFPRPKKIRITYLPPIAPKNLSIDDISNRVKEAIEKEMNRPL